MGPQRPCTSEDILPNHKLCRIIQQCVVLAVLGDENFPALCDGARAAIRQFIGFAIPSDTAPAERHLVTGWITEKHLNLGEAIERAGHEEPTPAMKNITGHHMLCRLVQQYVLREVLVDEHFEQLAGDTRAGVRQVMLLNLPVAEVGPVELARAEVGCVTTSGARNLPG